MKTREQKLENLNEILRAISCRSSNLSCLLPGNICLSKEFVANLRDIKALVDQALKDVQALGVQIDLNKGY